MLIRALCDKKIYDQRQRKDDGAYYHFSYLSSSSFGHALQRSAVVGGSTAGKTGLANSNTSNRSQKAVRCFFVVALRPEQAGVMCNIRTPQPATGERLGELDKTTRPAVVTSPAFMAMASSRTFFGDHFTQYSRLLRVQTPEQAFLPAGKIHQKILILLILCDNDVTQR